MEYIDVDFHVHTHHSLDCKSSIINVIKAAKKANLDAIAITDHDTLEGVKEAKKASQGMGVEIISGVEVTARSGTHIIGLFINELPKGKSVLKIIKEIKSLGGLSFLPHPYRRDAGLLYNWKNKNQFSNEQIKKILKSVDFIELINHKSLLKNEKDVLDEVKKWKKHFLGGSDAHFTFEIGNVRTRISSLSFEELLSNRKQIYFFWDSSFKKEKKRKKFNPISYWKDIIKKIMPSIFLRIFKVIINVLREKFIFEKKRRENRKIATEKNLYRIRQSDENNKIIFEHVTEKYANRDY